MSAAHIARLIDRGVVSVTGRDSEKLLQGLITNDLEQVAPGATPYPAHHAALLSPQGKILFDFFVVRVADGYLLDVDRAKAAELVKRLSMYKLRADVAIADASSRYMVFAIWGDGATARIEAGGGIQFADPRHPLIGLRLLAEAEAGDTFADETLDTEASHRRYDAERVRLGVPEGGKDYAFGDAYPHEANFDLLHGVSFTKGCYVGQEVVARMQNKTIVRKRVVKITAPAALTSGTDVLLGEAPIGRIGTVDGNNALAMLRLDRAVEAEQKNQKLTAGGIVVTPDAEALARYLATAAARPASALHT
jgi:folate-binding protein YgfZ